MSCESCIDILEVDDVEPDCFDEKKGCIIPGPGEHGRRVLLLRDKLLSLRNLVDAGTIIRMYDGTREDIELLAFLESELRVIEQEAGGDNG